MRWLCALACVGSLASVVVTTTGCEQLDGRNRTRVGNRLFRETQFIDAAAQYHKALTEVDDSIIHYNLGLAYSKIFKPGYEGPVLLGQSNEFVCQMIPNVKVVQAGACVKEGDRHYAECGEKKTKPLEEAIAKAKADLTTVPDTKDWQAQLKDKEAELNKECADLLPPTDAKPADPNAKPDPNAKKDEPKKKTPAELKEEQKKCAPIAAAVLKLRTDIQNADEKRTNITSTIKDKQDELARFTCPSSFKCMETSFCSLTSPELADLAAQHFQVWIKAQPSDEDIRKDMVGAQEELEAAKKTDNKSRLSSAQKRVDELGTKDQTRGLMTQLWLDSEQFKKAIEYWEGLSKERPGDTAIIGTLAGINLKAGDWRKSIELYNHVADMSKDVGDKVNSYQFIGNVAWAKLNSKTLAGVDMIELADKGLAALQKAAELQPKSPRPVGLQASIFNFRSTAQGVSWAAAIDRASGQDLSKLSHVLSDEAKKAQSGTPPSGTTPEAPPKPAGGG